MEALVSYGHNFNDVLGYSIPQAFTLHAAAAFRMKNEDMNKLSLLRMGAITANTEQGEFNKLLKELENGH